MNLFDIALLCSNLTAQFAVLFVAFTSDALQSVTSSKEATSYSKLGSIAVTIEDKSTASIAVNKCANTFEYSFKVQITTGKQSCVGSLSCS